MAIDSRSILTVLAEKICGGAAESKAPLAEVAELCRKVNSQSRSMGMALTSCTVPAAGKPTCCAASAT